jgi:hypothetical protein
LFYAEKLALSSFLYDNIKLILALADCCDAIAIRGLRRAA